MRVCDVCKKGPEVDAVKSAVIAFQVEGRPAVQTLLELHDECGGKLFADLSKVVQAAIGEWMKFVPIKTVKPEPGK